MVVNHTMSGTFWQSPPESSFLFIYSYAKCIVYMLSMLKHALYYTGAISHNHCTFTGVLNHDIHECTTHCNCR